MATLTREQARYVYQVRQAQGDAAADALANALRQGASLPTDGKAPPQPKSEAPVSRPSEAPVVASDREPMPQGTQLPIPRPEVDWARFAGNKAEAVATRTAEIYEAMPYGERDFAKAREQAQADVDAAIRPQPFVRTGDVKQAETGWQALGEALRPQALAGGPDSQKLGQELARRYSPSTTPEGVRQALLDEYGPDQGEAAYRAWLWAARPDEARRRMKEEYRQAGLGEKALRAALTKTDTTTGEVRESLFQTALRDIGGLWQFVDTPVAQALTYEVDEQGNPIDPEDYAYKARQWLDVPQQNLERGLAAKGSQLADQGILPKLFQPARRTSPDREKGGGVVETGNYLTDVASAIAQGRMIGDDLMAMPEYVAQTGDPNSTIPWWIGLGVEMIRPLSPLSAGTRLLEKGGTVARRVLAVRAGERALAGTGLEGVSRKAGSAAGANADTVLETVAREAAIEATDTARAWRAAQRAAIETPTLHLNIDDLNKAGIPATNIVMAALEDAAEAAKTRVLPITKIEEVITDAVTTRASDTMQEAISGAADLVARTDGRFAAAVQPDVVAMGLIRVAIQHGMSVADAARRIPHSPRVARLLRGPVEDVTSKLDKALDAYGEVGATARRVTARMDASRPSTSDLLWTEYSQASAAARKAGSFDPTTDGITAVAQRAIRSRLADAVPDDYVFLTPRLIASQDGWEKVGPRVVSETQQIMADNARAAEAFETAVGPVRLRESEVLRDIADGLARDGGKTLTPDNLKFAWDTVLVAKAMEHGAGVGLRMSGLAAHRAAKPVARRWQHWRDLGDLTEAVAPGVSNAVREFKKLLPIRSSSAPPRTPTPIRNWIDDLKSAAPRIPDQFTNRLAQHRKAGASPVEAFQRVLDEETARLASTTGKDWDYDSWRDLLTLFYGSRQRVLSNGFLKTVGTHEVTPTEVVKAFDRIDQELRKAGQAPLARMADGTVALTIRNAKLLIEDLQGGMSRLQSRGTKTTVLRDNYYFAWLSSWVMERMYERTARESLSRVMDMHPEVRIDLRGPVPKNLTPTQRGVLQSLVGIDARPISVAAQAAYERAADVGVDTLVENLINYKVGKGSPWAWPDTLGELVGQDRAKEILTTLRWAIRANRVPAAQAVEMERKIEGYLIGNLIGDIDADISNTIIGWGVTRGDDIERHLRHLVPKTASVTVDGLSPLYGSDVAREIVDIQKRIYDGSLADQLDELIRKDPNAGQYALRLGAELLDGVRRTTIGGTLGGLLLPNGRFLGMNILTAPLIVATTLSIPDALRATGVTRLANWISMQAGKAPSDLAFTDRLGRPWTKQAVEQAIDRNNLGRSQAGFEFAAGQFPEMMRDAKLNVDMSAAGGAKQVARWLAPWRKNVWNTFAEKSDDYFRRNVFVTALMEGKTEAEAAAMARESLLDYGKIGKAERDAVGFFVMFWSFRRQMALEALKLPLKNPALLRRYAMLEHAALSQFGEDAVPPDWAGTRLPLPDVFRTPEGRRREYGQPGAARTNVDMGPGNPALEAYTSFIIPVLSMANNAASGNFGELKAEGADFLYTPEFDLIKDIRDYGTDAEGAGYVPPNYVAALQEQGWWPMFVGRYNVEVVPVERQRAGDPRFAQRRDDGTLSGANYQYRFADRDGYHLFLRDSWIATRLGVRRTIDDYSKAAMLAGVVPEGTDTGRMGPDSVPRALLYLTGANTPIGVNTRALAEIRAQQQAMRELQSMAKEAQAGSTR